MPTSETPAPDTPDIDLTPTGPSTEPRTPQGSSCPCGEPHMPEYALEPALHRLTPREREVLLLLGKGLPNRLLANQLEIAERTAKAHVSRIVEKLDIQTRTQASMIALLHHSSICGS